LIEFLNLAMHKFKNYSEFIAQIWIKDPEILLKNGSFVIQSNLNL